MIYPNFLRGCKVKKRWILKSYIWINFYVRNVYIINWFKPILVSTILTRDLGHWLQKYFFPLSKSLSVPLLSINSCHRPEPNYVDFRFLVVPNTHVGLRTFFVSSIRRDRRSLLITRTVLGLKSEDRRF